MNKMRRIFFGLVLVGLIFLTGKAGWADPDAPFPAAPVVIASTVSVSPFAAYVVSVTSWVISNPGGLGPGGLIFAWQIVNSDPDGDIVESATAGPPAEWAPWIQSTGDIALAAGNALGALAGGVGALFHAPLPPGAAGGFPSFTFDFGGGFFGNFIPPGGHSEVLYAVTNAPSYKPGLFTVIDGGVSTGPLASYAPAVPEPASLLLLGTGLLGLAGAARKKLKNRKNENA